MSLVMEQCVPSDAPGFAEAFISAYERRPRHIVSMGSVSRERQLAIFTAAFRDSIESQEHPTPNQETHCLIVTDPDTNEIVAFAIWIHLPNGYRKDEDTLALVHDVPEGANEKLMREVSRMTTELRGDHEGRKGPHWMLTLIGTHPKHERRGAGTMLIRWGFAQADKNQERCYVDSSNVGYALYKRCGFLEDVGKMSVDLDQYGPQGLGVQTWVAMLREPQVKTSD